MKVVFDCFVLPHLGRIRNSVGWVLLLDLILVMCFFFYLNLYSVSLLPCKSWNKLENCRNKSTTVVVKRHGCPRTEERARK